MATSKEYALFVENQFRGLEGFTLKRMFGEYGMYLQGRVLGFLADEQIRRQRPTAEKREHGNVGGTGVSEAKKICKESPQATKEGSERRSPEFARHRHK